MQRAFASSKLTLSPHSSINAARAQHSPRRTPARALFTGSSSEGGSALLPNFDRSREEIRDSYNQPACFQSREHDKKLPNWMHQLAALWKSAYISSAIRTHSHPQGPRYFPLSIKSLFPNRSVKLQRAGPSSCFYRHGGLGHNV